MMTCPLNKSRKNFIFPRRRSLVLPRSVVLRGYREFIFKYQQQKDTLSAPQQDMNPLTQRVLRSYANVREISQGLIDDEQLERVAQMIEQSERVYFFGTGSSGLVAREMKLRFMRLGVVCEALTDPDGFAWTTSIIDENVWSLVFPSQEQHRPSSIVY